MQLHTENSISYYEILNSGGGNIPHLLVYKSPVSALTWNHLKKGHCWNQTKFPLQRCPHFRVWSLLTWDLANVSLLENCPHFRGMPLYSTKIGMVLVKNQRNLYTSWMDFEPHQKKQSSGSTTINRLMKNSEVYLSITKVNCT